jgi:hypothetical protein
VNIKSLFSTMSLVAVTSCGLFLATNAMAQDSLPVRLSLRHDNELVIGQYDPVAMDARGSEFHGHMTSQGDGTALLQFTEFPVQLPTVHLRGVPLALRMQPQRLEGSVNFCSGDVDLRYVADVRLGSRAVAVWDSVLSTSAVLPRWGGESLSDFGDVTLAGQTLLEKTGKLADLLIDLPAPSALKLGAHLQFPAGRFYCPGEERALPTRMRLGLGRHSELYIASFPRFDYSAPGGEGIGRVLQWNGSVATVYIDGADLTIPPLAILPGNGPYGGVGVEISTQSLSGTVDVCSGEMHMAFDAAFTPYMFGFRWPTSISVITDLTTESSSGMHYTEQGQRVNRYGDGLNVGVAVVPLSGDAFIDWFLSLPNDAVALLQAHLDWDGDIAALCDTPAP